MTPPSPPPPSLPNDNNDGDKGKQKASSSSTTTTGFTSTLAQTLTCNLKADLSSLLSGTTKSQQSIGRNTNQLHDWIVQDILSSSSSSNVRQDVKENKGFRTIGSDSDSSYLDFQNVHQQSKQGKENETRWDSKNQSPLLLLGPITTASQLDQPLYESVRLSCQMDFFQLLQQEEEEQENQGWNLSKELNELHENLTLQQDQDVNQESIQPRLDDQQLGQGVYSSTDEKALESIWNARQSENHSSSSVVDRITTWFGETNYIDDVYGMPPLLTKTIQQATQSDQETKRIAIRRLEALWNHLSSTTPPSSNNSQHVTPSTTATGWIDEWLLKQP